MQSKNLPQSQNTNSASKKPWHKPNLTELGLVQDTQNTTTMPPTNDGMADSS